MVADMVSFSNAIYNQIETLEKTNPNLSNKVRGKVRKRIDTVSDMLADLHRQYTRLLREPQMKTVSSTALVASAYRVAQTYDL